MTITKLQAVVLFVTVLVAAIAGVVCTIAFIGTPDEIQFALMAAVFLPAAFLGARAIGIADLQ